MKQKWIFLFLALCMVFSVPTMTRSPRLLSFAQAISPASQTATLRDLRLFYEKLAPYGDWMTLAPHGWVWLPQFTPPGWHPYTEGRWVYTEAGVTWVSEWVWGWATFHYGRWLFNEPYGWAWVPGTVWAPAWVAWQVDNGWVGWAPLPPQVTWDPKVGLSTDRLDLVNIEPLRYVFVAAQQLLEPSLQGHVVSPARNVTLLLLTRHVTAYIPVEDRVHNRSLSLEQVAHLVHHPVPQYELQTLDPTSADVHTQIKGRDIIMFRPVLTKPGPGHVLPLPEPPSPTTTPPPKAPQAPMQTDEQRALEERLATERERLIARQEKEAELLVARGQTREDIQQQHERERRAFALYAERERRVLEHRLKRKRQKRRLRLLYDESGGLRSLDE